MAESRRKTIRLKGFDYKSCAAYFVTICCANKMQFFGKVERVNSSSICNTETIVDDDYRVRLTEDGEACMHVLNDAKSNGGPFRITEFIVMPDHVHFIAVAERNDAKQISLGSFVHYLKSSISRSVHESKPGVALWQKGYFDHVIRDEYDYERIAEYIASNPARWVIKRQGESN